MSPPFIQASRVTRTKDRTYVCDVPDGWKQGRGAFGGLGIAIALRALETEETERPLRALTAELPGPLLPGAALVRTQSLRAGKGMSTLEATVVQDGETKVRVTGLFGVERTQDLASQPPPPKPSASFDTLDPIANELLAPQFTQYFEYRVTGPLPFLKGPEAVAEGWVGFRDALPTYGPAELVALADAYWPSFFVTLDTFRPMGTIAFSMQLTNAALHLDASQPLYHRARTIAGSAGYVFELRELWTADGALVALNPQTMCIIR